MLQKEQYTDQDSNKELIRQTLLQEIARLNQSSVVGEILQIKDKDIYLDFKPTLFEIAEETKNYELAKLMINQDGFMDQLAKVNDNQCYMHDLIENVKGVNPIV